MAVVGTIPELNNEKIHFETISLDEFSEDTLHISTNFDAVMITPVMFEEASADKLVKAYENAKIPIVFLNHQNVIFHLQEKELHLKRLIGNH